MDLQDVSKDLTKQTAYRLEQRFLRLLRTNPRYKNLDSGNRDVILDLIEKYKEKMRHGIKPSRLTIKNDMYRLYRNRLDLKLTYHDLDQIRDLLEEFK